MTTLADEIQTLERLDLAALREAWRERFGAPPSLRSRELMAHAFAYRLQVEAHGDLSPLARRRLADYGRRFADDRDYSPTPGALLSVGCSLVREWGGARHEVWVVEGGYRYQGALFASLSALAWHITGAKRSGHVFFGLKGRAGGVS